MVVRDHFIYFPIFTFLAYMHNVWNCFYYSPLMYVLLEKVIFNPWAAL